MCNALIKLHMLPNEYDKWKKKKDRARERKTIHMTPD